MSELTQTMRVRLAGGTEAVINKDDFDPAEHTEVKAKAADAGKPDPKGTREN